MIRLPQPPSVYKLTNALDSARQLFDFSRNLVSALEIQQTQVNRTTQAQTQETEEVEIDTGIQLSPEEQEVQSALEKALDAAKKLGNPK